MDTVRRRLKQVQEIIRGQPNWRPILVLPDDARVAILDLPSAASSDGAAATRLAIDECSILDFRALPREAALVLSAIGTPFEGEGPSPKYPVLEITGVDDKDGHPKAISIPDLWGAIHALWTLLHTQEHIPIVTSPAIPNTDALIEYLLVSGLGRRSLRADELIFLDRGAFWQEAGTGPQWENPRGWQRGLYAARTMTFPAIPSFTRTDLVIAAHPLRPPKPPPGACIYKRYCTPVGQMLAFHVVDLGNEAHMAAFHRWHNDERVHRGWGERGTMEHHRAYITKVTADPAILPFMMSWDDELMGYAELVWIKENHLAAYIPGGARDHDRGLHVLVGEDKFRGQLYSQAWFRSATHYIFLADSRTSRLIGEPKRSNPAIIKTSVDGGMHLETSFYFPYKYSIMTMNLRERFFKEDLLT